MYLVTYICVFLRQHYLHKRREHHYFYPRSRRLSAFGRRITRVHVVQYRNHHYRQCLPTPCACPAAPNVHWSPTAHYPGADPGGGSWGARPPRPWGGVSPFKMHYSIAFKHQSINGRPPTLHWEKSCIRPCYPPPTANGPRPGSSGFPPHLVPGRGRCCDVG